MKIVEEECDETILWLEFVVELGYFQPEKVTPVTQEARELFSIIVASTKTARKNQ